MTPIPASPKSDRIKHWNDCPGSHSERQRVGLILCADWGKETTKRALYAADVRAPRVYRLPPPSSGWTLSTVLEAARERANSGSALCTFDVPLGVSEGYLAATLKSRNRQGSGFLQFLQQSARFPDFFNPVHNAEDWSVERPFFAVPGGPGSLNAFRRKAQELGVDQLERQIDKVTDAKPVFIASGIPGSVGSAAIALWRELAPLLLKNRTFRVWPFEGRLTDLRRTPVIVGEIYPGAAYTSALAEAIPAPRLRLAKTRAETRRSALSVLHSMRWALDLDVRFDGVQEAEESEDDFDACLTAAGLLRCVLQGLPLYAIFEDVAGVEGGILGAGTIDFSRPAQGFPADAAQETPQPPRSAAAPVTGQTFRCPISGCDKVFQKSRWGWDAHVGSLKKHPQWRPDLTSPPLRCEAFRREFPEFFDQASSAQLDPSERQRRQMLSLRQHPTAILPKRRRRALRPTYKRSGGAESGST